MSMISDVESVFWEEPYTIPGPCKTCCLRCPCPSIITAIVFVLGVVIFSTGAILAGDETVLLFLETNAFSVFRSWNDYIGWAIYVELVVMVLLGVVLLSLGFLGTGSTRKERMCKFKNRATGRCQTGVFMIVAYFMFILWLAETFLSLAPVMFFVVQNRGVCRVYHPEEKLPARDINGDIINDDRQGEELCIDLRQWGLVDVTDIDPQQQASYQRNFVCGSEANRICNESWVLWYWCACFGGACIVLFAMLHSIINMSANYAKLRKGFKKGRVDRKTGTYVTAPSSRAGSLRGSRRSLALRGSRNSLLRGSKHSMRGSRNNMLHNGPGSSISVSASQPIQNGPSENSTLRMNAAFDAQPPPPMSGSGDNLVRDDYYLTPSFGGNMNTGYNDPNGYNDHNGYNENNGSNSSWGANTNMTNGSTFTNLKAELENLDKETPYAMSNGTHQFTSQPSHVGSSVASSDALQTRYAQPQFPSTIGSRQPLPTATLSTFSEPDPPSIQSLDSSYKERHEYFI